jgi:hypothetical protein
MGARITAAIAATPVAVLVAAAYAGAAGAPSIATVLVATGTVPTTPTAVTVSACRAAQLSAVYALDPFSQGLGNVSYTLTITNKSKAICTVSWPLSVRLLGKHGQALPTHASASPSGPYQVTLAPKQWAQVESRFSPDVDGPGEGTPCEKTAHSLRIAVGSGHVVAPMDPTSVCEHGQIGFERLIAIASHPACKAGHLTATFKRVGTDEIGGAFYGLALKNTGSAACYLEGVPNLRLLTRAGGALPTREARSVPYPIIVAPHKQVSSLAGFASISRPGTGEPRHGACEPKAAKVRIDPRPGGGTLTTALTPPTTVCRHGLMSVSGLLPGYSFG